MWDRELHESIKLVTEGRHIWLSHLAVLAVTAFFAASGSAHLLSTLLIREPSDGVSTPVRPRQPPPRRQASLPVRSGDTICERNIFSFKNRPCVDDPVSDLDVGAEMDEGGIVTKLCEAKAELVGTVTSPVEGWSFAMIEADDKTMPYRVGDEVPNVGEVERIGWRLVLVDREVQPDCLLDVYAERSRPKKRRKRGRDKTPSTKRRRRRRGPSKEMRKAIKEGIETVSATERNVDRGLVEKLMENPADLMRTVRVRPHTEKGQVAGFKVYRIRRDSLLGQLGLRNGDVVRSVNNIDITSADTALSAYTKLRTQDQLTLSITRRNKNIDLDFNIR